MSETRRQLFKTSIMSALGLTAVGSLAGCNNVRTGTGAFGSSPDQNNPVVGIDKNGYVYIFNYDGTHYTAYLTHPSSSSYVSTLAKMGTIGLYNDRKSAGDLSAVENKTIYIPTKTANAIIDLPIYTMSGGVVKNPLALSGSVILTPTWNEIGGV